MLQEYYATVCSASLYFHTHGSFPQAQTQISAHTHFFALIISHLHKKETPPFIHSSAFPLTNRDCILTTARFLPALRWLHVLFLGSFSRGLVPCPL